MPRPARPGGGVASAGALRDLPERAHGVQYSTEGRTPQTLHMGGHLVWGAQREATHMTSAGWSSAHILVNCATSQNRIDTCAACERGCEAWGSVVKAYERACQARGCCKVRHCMYIGSSTHVVWLLTARQAEQARCHAAPLRATLQAA